ncbi:MAG: GldG family protein [Planctomycetes bacterium]|nr:GldG family protein [Planctomycetota bacterium]
MEVNAASAPPAKPGAGKRPVSKTVKVFRLVGSFACFAIMVNLFVCLARDSFTDPFALVPFVVLGTVLVFSVFVCREEFLESIRSPRFKVMVIGMTQGAIAFIILCALLYILGFRFYTRADITTDKLNQLAGESIKMLELLRDTPDSAEAVFLLGEDPPMGDPTRDEIVGPKGLRSRVETLLKEYQAQADLLAPGKFRYSMVHMLEEPATMERLAQKMGMNTFPPDTQESVVFILGEKSKLITQGEMHGIGFGRTGARRTAEFQAERVFTASLRGMLKPERKLAVFASGNGEADPKETQRIRELCRRQGIEVREANLDENEELPAGAAVLVLLGPRQALKPAAVERIKAFLEKGGSLLLLADAVFPQAPGMAAEPCGLAPLLETYGIRLRQDYVTRGLKPATIGQPTVLSLVPGQANAQSGAPVLATLRMQEQTVAFSLPCALEVVKATREGYQSEALLVSPPYQARDQMCWADPAAVLRQRTQADADSIRGPVPLAIASLIPAKEGDAKAPRQGARLLVLAGSSAAQDKYFNNYPGNPVFMLAALRWTAGEDELVSEIPPRDPQVRVAKIEEGAGRVLIVLLVLGLPAAMVFCGLVMWTIRRN